MSQKFDKGSDMYNLILSGMCKDCVILSAKTQMAHKDLSPAEIGSGVYTHHIIMTDLGRPQIPSPVNINCPGLPRMDSCIAGKGMPAMAKFLPKASVFMAIGGDGRDVLFTSKDRSVQSGYHLGSKDRMVAQAEVINYDAIDKEVYFSLDYEYLQGRPAGTLDVSLSAIDISGCFKFALGK